MNNNENIPFDNNHGTLPEDILLAYMAGKLTAEKQREVELWLANDGMESDAVEGLSQITPEKTTLAVKKLNKKLRKSIAQKRKYGKRTIKADYVSLLATIVIIIITIAAFIIIKLLLKK